MYSQARKKRKCSKPKTNKRLAVQDKVEQTPPKKCEPKEVKLKRSDSYLKRVTAKICSGTITKPIVSTLHLNKKCQSHSHWRPHSNSDSNTSSSTNSDVVPLTSPLSLPPPSPSPSYFGWKFLRHHSFLLDKSSSLLLDKKAKLPKSSSTLSLNCKSRGHFEQNADCEFNFVNFHQSLSINNRVTAGN